MLQVDPSSQFFLRYILVYGDFLFSIYKSPSRFLIIVDHFSPSILTKSDIIELGIKYTNHRTGYDIMPQIDMGGRMHKIWAAHTYHF